MGFEPTTSSTASLLRVRLAWRLGLAQAVRVLTALATDSARYGRFRPYSGTGEVSVPIRIIGERATATYP